MQGASAPGPAPLLKMEHAPSPDELASQAVIDLADRLDSLESDIANRFEAMRSAFVDLRSQIPVDPAQRIHDDSRRRLIEFIGYTPSLEQQLQLFKAYAEWHSTLPTLQTNREADFRSKEGNRVHYHYADLAAVIATAQTAAAKGLCAITRQEFDDKRIPIVTAYLVHIGGGVINSGPVPLFTSNSGRAGQDHAKGLTTCRRLALQIVLGLAAERDDDFNGSEETSPPQTRSTPAPPRKPVRTFDQGPVRPRQPSQGPPPGWLSREDRQRLETELMDSSITPDRFQEIENLLKAANTSSSSAYK